MDGLDYRFYKKAGKLLGQPTVAERTFRHQSQESWETLLRLKKTPLAKALGKKKL